MNSIGDLIDKLIIENIKLFSIRDKIHNEELTDEEKTNLYETMSILNENRGIICNYLDNKVDNVISNTEKNLIIKNVKTYNLNEKQ